MLDHFSFVRNFIMGIAVALTVTVAPALANVKYLDFESTGSPSELPVKGEVTDGDIKGTMVKVTAFSFGSGKEGVRPKSSIGSTTGGAGAGKVTATAESLDVTVGMEATQKLFDLAALGKPIAHVRLLIFKDGLAGTKIPFYSALMSDVMIVSLNWTGKSDDKPTANVTLDYRTIEITKNTKAGGVDPKTPNSWNLVTNKSDLSAP